MKRLFKLAVCLLVVSAGSAQAYLIQGLELDIEYWAGSGENACVIAIDWNNTNGPYNSEFHLFGYNWQGTAATLAEALSAIDADGVLDIAYNYDWGFIETINYDQTLIDGDVHTNEGYGGWWWIGSTIDAGQTWIAGNGIENDILWDGGIFGLNVDEGVWTSSSMTIPEPVTITLLAAGLLLMRSRK